MLFVDASYCVPLVKKHNECTSKTTYDQIWWKNCATREDSLVFKCMFRGQEATTGKNWWPAFFT